MPSPPAPRKRRKEARPSELLAAALDLFVEKGYAATRLEDVASCAGVSKGTLYLYYENKEALFKALPDVPKAEIVWRFHFMLGATSYAIAGTDALRVVTDWQIEEADATDRLDRLVPRLMSFLLGGLRAPLPQFSDTTATSS
ncbi:hypothetical protein SDC9_117547 [bioreactor metagenome]|uniref:HTH tetR-type domain-containing protein n=1 Tax=bioreactor metagenome TaxID=1076179 RepID=A0A645BZ22_9ZZZZ